MSEKQRVRPQSFEKSKEEERQNKLAKLKKLQELQAKLHKKKEEKKQKEVGVVGEEKIFDEIANIDQFEAKILSQVEKAGAAQELSASDEKLLEQELSRLEAEIQKGTGTAVSKKSSYEKLLEKHDWLEKPNYGFMYSIPNIKNQQEDFLSWKQEWGNVLLDYCETATHHLIHMNKIQTDPPFNKFNNRDAAIYHMGQELVDRDLAKWLGKKKKKKFPELRVLWRTNDEWAGLIQQWALDNAIFDLMMLNDIRDTKEEFSNMPEADLRQIFTTIQNKYGGKMVDLGKDQIGIKFHIL